MIRHIEFSKQAEKDLRSVPKHIFKKLMAWAEDVEKLGLETLQKIPGFHDEPPQGQRWGCRSIRLNRSYRAIYKIHKTECIEFVMIEEVNKHDY